MLGLLAAAAHDVDHPGVNQPFLIKTNHHLANLYQVREPNVESSSANWLRPSARACLTFSDSLPSRSASMMTTAKEHGFEIGPGYSLRKITFVYKGIQGIQFSPKQI